MKPLPFRKLGSIGVISDIAHSDVPHNGYTNSNNVVFRNGKAKKLRGFDEVADKAEASLKIQRGWESTVPVVFLATATDIWKLLSGAWTNVSRNAAGEYSTTEWDSVLFGDFVIFTTTNEPPQVFDSGTSKFIDLPNWPADLRCERLRVFGSQLIAFGVTESGTQRLYAYVWSDFAPVNGLPVSWDYGSTTSLAGIAEIPAETGQILDGGELGNSFMIYSTHACHELRRTGTTAPIFSRHVIHRRGLLNPRAFVAYDNQHFVVGQDSTYIHSGGRPQSIGRNRIDKKFYRDMSSLRKVFVAHDPKNHEVRTFVQQLAGAVSTPFMLWNYFDNTFTFGTLPEEVIDADNIPTPPTGVTWADLQAEGTLWSELGMTWAELGGADSAFSLMWLQANGKLFTESLNFNVATVDDKSALLERIGIDLDELAPRPIGDFMFVDRVVPQINGSGIVKFQFGRMTTVNSGPTWDPVEELDLDADQDEVTFMIETSYFCYRLFSDDTGYWDFSGFDLYAQPSGEQ